MTSWMAGVPRVDLMPRAVRERRLRRRMVRVWLAVVCVATLVAGAMIAGAWWLQQEAEARVAVEQAQTEALAEKLRGYTDVSAALRERDALVAYRERAAGDDTVWQALLEQVERALPDEARVIGFELAAGGAAAASDPESAAGPHGTFRALTEEPIDLATVVRTLRGQPGVLTVDARSLAADSDGYRMELTIMFDQTVYTGIHQEEEEQ